MEEGTRKSGDLWSGIALAALGGYIIIQARQWEYLGTDGPGAGFFPLWYGVAILGLSLLLIVLHLRRGSARGNALDWTRLGRAFSTWFALAVSVALFKPLGFVVSFALLTYFILAVIDRPPLATAALGAVPAAGRLFTPVPPAPRRAPPRRARGCLPGRPTPPPSRGPARAALGIVAIASFVAGTVGVLGLMLVAPPIAKFALSFSSPEYFALMSLGLALVVLLAGRSIVKALLAALMGLWIASVGTDLFSGTSRFAFGQMELLSGIDFVVVAIGVFALAEVLANMEAREETQLLPVPKGLKNLLPTMQDLKDCRFAFVNGSVIGFLVGALPGGGSTIASFLSYGLEKAVSPRREQFGTGVIEGVAAPEGANNSETGGALVPLLTLGIPGSGTTAILLAALVLWGFKPGPLFIPEHPALFWGLVASMYIGNVMLLVLNLPLVPLFAQVLRTPGFVLYPLILGISIVGVYSASSSVFDVALLVAFGLLGYLMRKLDYPAAPLILGVVLGGAMLARAVALMLEKEKLLPVRMQVVNKTGGNGAVAAAYLAEKKGDPNTIGFFTGVWLNNPLTSVEAKVTLKDLTPVARLVLEPAVIAVKADAPYKTLPDFIAAAKQSPGQLKQSGGSVTSRDNVVRQLLQRNP